MDVQRGGGWQYHRGGLGGRLIPPVVALSSSAETQLFCITSAPPCRRERPRGRSILASCTAQKHCPCTPGWTDLGCLPVLVVLGKRPPRSLDFPALDLRWAGCSSTDPAARSSGRAPNWAGQRTGPCPHRCHCTVRAHCIRSSPGQARILAHCPLRWNPSRHSRCRDH